MEWRKMDMLKEQFANIKEEQNTIIGPNYLIPRLSTNINYYSPVVIQGNAGTGKTFFAKSLCSQLRQNGIIKDFKINHAKDFIDSFIASLMVSETIAWRQKFLDLEMIVIDNFHDLSGKFAAQEELLSIFQNVQKPIIVTTEIPLCCENGFSEGLKQFLSEGVRIYLETPRHEEIISFFNQQIQESHIRLSEEAYQWFSEQSFETFAQVRGIIKTLQLHCKNTDNCIDLKTCKKFVKPLISKIEKS